MGTFKIPPTLKPRLGLNYHSVVERQYPTPPLEARQHLDVAEEGEHALSLFAPNAPFKSPFKLSQLYSDSNADCGKHCSAVGLARNVA
jgi:hypothetical protein